MSTFAADIARTIYVLRFGFDMVLRVPPSREANDAFMRLVHTTDQLLAYTLGLGRLGLASTRTVKAVRRIVETLALTRGPKPGDVRRELLEEHAMRIGPDPLWGDHYAWTRIASS